MVNHKVITAALAQLPKNSMPLLSELRDRLSDEKPYKGLIIFHNVPLTLSTLFKIEVLLSSGAEVIVSNVAVVPLDQKLVQILKAANLHCDFDKKNVPACDVYLDCCAELIHHPLPTYGIVELTQTGSKLYKESNINFPIISIDDSPLKNLETIGTGLGFLEAFQKQVNEPIEGKKFILFGYGKVGQGIYEALLPFTNNIIVIDQETNVLKLKARNIKAISINFLNHIKQELVDAFCVVTATGCDNLISNHFDKVDFRHIPYLVNMGASDEYGDKFLKGDVLLEKSPLNFSLKYPTPLKYLDPVFYAHNIAIDLLLDSNVPKKYHAFPDWLAMETISQWER